MRTWMMAGIAGAAAAAFATAATQLPIAGEPVPCGPMASTPCAQAERDSPAVGDNEKEVE